MLLQDALVMAPLTRRMLFAGLSLFLLLILAYGNSFDASWHFDDYPNIVANPNLHISDLSMHSIRQGIYGKNGSTLFRPAAMLSFALNYYFGEYRVWGYHLVNFAVHCLSAFGLFLFILSTLNLPSQRQRYGGIAYPVALIATIFWATSPVQVSAVTYIVQRMTSLAGLGYIYSMLFYLLARMAETRKRFLYYGLSLLMALLSFTSKESSFFLPIAIILFDLLLISGMTRRKAIRIGFILVLTGIAILAASTIYTNPLTILDGYAGRPFTLGQRLLTEPRIIFFYLSLLFHPSPDRLTLMHDIELSTSLFSPFSTFTSLALLAGILVACLAFAKKWPLITFCCLFFFLNHLIEGSVIPLELIYEHRNYLPSMLIFVPLALLLVATINTFSYSRPLQSAFCGGLIILVIAQAHTTTMRNEVFRSEISLWEDCVAKAPDLQRALINLGTAYSKNGQIAWAIACFEKAEAEAHNLNKRATVRNQLIHANLGGAYYRLGDMKQAARYYSMDLNESGNGPPKSLEGMALIRLQEDRLPEAEEFISRVLVGQPSNPGLLVIASEILLRQGKAEEAIKKGQLALRLDQTRDKALFLLGLALRSQGRDRRALDYFSRFLERRPLDLAGHLAMIEVCQTLGETALVARYVTRTVALTGPDELEASLAGFSNDFSFEGYQPEETIRRAFSETLQHYLAND